MTRTGASSPPRSRKTSSTRCRSHGSARHRGCSLRTARGKPDMANIAKRPDGRWRARYRDAAGKEHARHFPRKADAQRWLDEVTASVVTGAYVDPKAGRVTFAAYFK